MSIHLLRLTPDEPRPYVSPFLKLPLRSRAQVLEDIERARTRVRRREPRKFHVPL